MVRRTAQALCVSAFLVAFALNAQQAAPAAGALHEVKSIHVQPTVIANPDKVKDPEAASLVENSLKDALTHADINAADDAPVTAHVVLDEFSSGSVAKRMTVGFGSGRSSIFCHLVLQDASGKELANVPVHVRGNMRLNGYEGNGTQKRQALSSLDHALTEELEKLK